MTAISILEKAGSFAENKDVARGLRLHYISPALKEGDGDVVLDFKGVSGATQSFVHALISQLIRKYGDELFTKLKFKNCNDTIKEVINIVADYMSES